MFLIRPQARTERPIRTISDLYRVLDEKMFPEFSSKPLSKVGVGFFKQHAMELFRSYYDFGLVHDLKLLQVMPSFLNDYLTDRFRVPYAHSREIKLIPRWDSTNWVKRGGIYAEYF